MTLFDDSVRIEENRGQTTIDQKVDTRYERSAIGGEKFDRVRDFQHGSFTLKRGLRQHLVLAGAALKFDRTHWRGDETGRDRDDAGASLGPGSGCPPRIGHKSVLGKLIGPLWRRLVGTYHRRQSGGQ